MLRGDVEKLIDTLSAREKDVIRMRFGLDAGKPKTLEEIGNVFSVTRERVRQIEARALHKLRQPYRNHQLRAYSDVDANERQLADQSPFLLETPPPSSLFSAVDFIEQQLSLLN